MIKRVPYRLRMFVAMQLVAFLGLFKPDEVQSFIDHAEYGKAAREKDRKMAAMRPDKPPVDRTAD